MIHVVHIITGLEVGGAEMMLVNLLGRMDRQRFRSHVISLTGMGPLGDRLRAEGFEVDAVAMAKGPAALRGLGRLMSLLRHARPAVVQTWMYHANLLGGLAARLALPKTPVAWGLHHANLDPARLKQSTLWTARAGAWGSRGLADRIVCCAEAAREAHAAIGYAPDRMTVIPNGFDPARFRPDPAARAELRQELGFDDATPLIGLVGRFDPLKDHANFVQAALALAHEQPEVAFVLCGQGVTWDNPELTGPIRAAGLAERFRLLGRRDDIPRIQAGLDLAASSSCGEAFPLAIGEAMACGVPCVVTDVGNSASLVAQTGRVVPPHDPLALAAAWAGMLAEGPEGLRARGAAARQRVEDHFSLASIAGRYERLYRELANGC